MFHAKPLYNSTMEQLPLASKCLLYSSSSKEEEEDPSQDDDNEEDEGFLYGMAIEEGR